MKAILLLAIAALAFSSLFMGWLAPLTYYAASLLQPQALWPWRFDGVPIFKIFAALTLLTATYYVFARKVETGIYRSKITYALFVLFITRNASHYFAPFDAPDQATYFFISIITETTNTIFIMYLAALAILNNERHLKKMTYILIGTCCYFTYWANLAYFQYDWTRFSQGRLMGLGDSQYADGNVLSVLLIIGYPFIVIKLFNSKQLLHKLAYGILILMLWHALFLFGSRGALLGLLLSSLMLYRNITSTFLKLSLAAALTAAIVLQGGATLERSSETVEASRQGGEEPLNPRLVSWEVGRDLFLSYPVLGVGPGRFLIASNTLYPGRSPHVAHNTIISLAAESGLFAAVAFLMLLLSAWKVTRFINRNKEKLSHETKQTSDAAIAAIGGFSVCSIFLDLTIFEPLYFLIIMIQINDHCAKKQIGEAKILQMPI